MIAGKRILIVEDEPIVALLLEDMLTELGACAVGPAADVAGALAILEAQAVDAAVLDVNLGHERSDLVVDRLVERGTPFIFATGYGREHLAPHVARVLVKPYRLEQLEEALSAAFELATAEPFRRDRRLAPQPEPLEPD